MGDRAKALPAFHAFTGADNSVKFSRIGKATWLQHYVSANQDIIESFQMLISCSEVSDGMLTSLASFVCAAYAPTGINMSTIPELRWHLFCKHMAESDKLPPTLGALKQHANRVLLQTNVWGQATIAMQQCFNPIQHGYYLDAASQLKPITTHALPAPKAIIEMVRCQCKADFFMPVLM